MTPERVGEIGSTNTELAARAAAGAREGTVLLADRQTAGRGRLGRRWLDHPGGSVLCSILFRPYWPAERWHLAGWVVAMSARDAVRDETGADCRCKWPNDLISLTGAKLAGVLAESVPAAGSGPAGLVVGIGVNCNWPSDFPPPGEPGAAEVARSATSLDRLVGRRVDRDAIADAMLGHVARRWSALGPLAPAPDRSAAASLASEYRAACATIGQVVRVELPSDSVSGRVLDVDDDGRLLVDVGSCIRTIGTGDVVHLRPAGGAAG